MVFFSRAQGAIEYLLIIGAAIIVVAVVIVAITSVSSSGKTQLNSAGASHAIDPLKEASGNYIKISDYYYPKSDIGSGLVGLWHFDEKDGSNNLLESVSKTYAGQLTGGAALSSTSKWGSALYVTGGQYVTGLKSLPTTGPLTFSAWVYPASLSNSTLFNNNGYRFIVNSANMFYLSYGPHDCFGGGIPVGKWSNVVFVVGGATAGSSLTAYVNGVPSANGSCRTTLSATMTSHPSDQTFIFGKDYHIGGGTVWDGYIDEVAIWNRALSDSEIQTLYNNSQ